MKQINYLCQPVRGVQAVDVGVVSSEQRITARGEHDGREGVAVGQAARGVAEHQVAGARPLQHGQHLLHSLPQPEHLHPQRLLQNVAQHGPTGLG